MADIGRPKRKIRIEPERPANPPQVEPRREPQHDPLPIRPEKQPVRSGAHRRAIRPEDEDG
jgi:hypothetical protein